MNKLVKRGLKAYNIFLKNKLATSLMMLVSGILMTYGGITGNGNDTKTLPFFILLAGGIFSFWSFYRLGYMKNDLEKPTKASERGEGRKSFFLQIGETLLYLVVVTLGVFLLMNEQFTNKILNLMAGGFTTFGGVLGVINAIKKRNNIDFRWKFMLILTLFELVWGIYFIIASDSIGVGSYIIMGIITTVAGLIEVINSFNADTLNSTIEDGRNIVKTLKDDDPKLPEKSQK